MSRKKRQGLTTEEVSEILGGTISQSTVQRYLDQGILTGWKNPTTGRMVIDPESVKAFVASTREWASTVRKAVDDFSEAGGNVVKKK